MGAPPPTCRELQRVLNTNNASKRYEYVSPNNLMIRICYFIDDCREVVVDIAAMDYSTLLSTKFMETVGELGNRYSEVIALQEIATYGALCVLASFDRTKLKNKAIDNLNLRNFLESVPEVRELAHNFYSSYYASCLDYLGDLKTTLLLDIHLHDHVETLYEEVHHKALIQYTHLFVAGDLSMMASAFKTSVASLEKEREALITDNQIQVLSQVSTD